MQIDNPNCVQNSVVTLSRGGRIDVPAGDSQREPGRLERKRQLRPQRFGWQSRRIDGRQQRANASYTGNLTSTSTLTKVGTNTETLTGNNTFSGISVNGGTLIAGPTASGITPLGTAPITLSTATLQLPRQAGSSSVYANNLTIAGSANANLDLSFQGSASAVSMGTLQVNNGSWNHVEPHRGERARGPALRLDVRSHDAAWATSTSTLPTTPAHSAR